MADFRGYLLKAGNKTDNSWLVASTYSSRPNQREQVLAERDEVTRALYLQTYPRQYSKTSIRFEVLPMNLEEKIAFQKFFTDTMVTEEDKDQRKVKLTYWNDEDNVYKEGYFYFPDIEYPIDTYDDDTIYYNSFEMELVEF